MVQYTQVSTIKDEAILAAIKQKKQISCILPYSSRENDEFLAKILKIFSTHLGKPFIEKSLSYSLVELHMNSNKANLKRIYFKNSGLNINDPGDYKKGMVNFRDEVFKNIETYKKQLIESGYYVQTHYEASDKNFTIKIANNSILCGEEESRIKDRLSKADKFTNLNEALTFGLDTSEGGGFGLILLLLSLRKVGLTDKVVSIEKNDKETCTLIKIPLNLLNKEQGTKIAKEITDEIEKMPQFPESILRLQKELANPNSDFNSISKIIVTDPSLTTEVIRIANSAIYMLPKKVADVPTAVRMIGIKGIKNLVYSFAVNKIFKDKFKKEKLTEVLNHSYEVAVYSSQIIKFKKLNSLRDDVYVGALIHDLGKLIVNTLQPELVKKIEDVCKKKNLPVSTLEDLSEGYNHSLVGALLAQKWNFPEKFIQAIKFHHIPLEAKEEFKVLVYSVYLGNEMYYYHLGKRDFEKINFKVLRFFGLDKEEVFKKIASDVEDKIKKS